MFAPSKNPSAEAEGFLLGAGDRTRTGTLSPAVDFECSNSAGLQMPALHSNDPQSIEITEDFGMRHEISDFADSGIRMQIDGKLPEVYHSCRRRLGNEN